mgnify:FL=1
MYTLHYSPDTASLAIRMVLAELGVPHKSRQIDRAAGELDSPAYRALHPMGKIPAIETPDGPMFETAAILLYLCDRHDALAPAPKSPERAAFLKWLFFTSTNIHPTLMQLFYPERTAGAAHADAVLAHASAHMNSLLTMLNDMVTVDAPKWLSTEPGLLGYYIGMLMRWLASVPADHPGHFPSTKYPALHRILAALETRPAALAIAQDEGLGATVFTKPQI